MSFESESSMDNLCPLPVVVQHVCDCTYPVSYVIDAIKDVV